MSANVQKSLITLESLYKHSPSLSLTHTHTHTAGQQVEPVQLSSDSQQPDKLAPNTQTCLCDCVCVYVRGRVDPPPCHKHTHTHTSSTHLMKQRAPSNVYPSSHPVGKSGKQKHRKRETSICPPTCARWHARTHARCCGGYKQLVL